MVSCFGSRGSLHRGPPVHVFLPCTGKSPKFQIGTESILRALTDLPQASFCTRTIDQLPSVVRASFYRGLA